MSWRTPTTYLQRLGDAMSLLCSGNRPSNEILEAWLNECEDDIRLQEFACKHGPGWAQGIAVIDAAQVLADQPTEILCIDGLQIDHERHNAGGEATGAKAQQNKRRPILGRLDQPVMCDGEIMTTMPGTGQTATGNSGFDNLQKNNDDAAVPPAPTFKRLESVWIGKDNALLDAMFEFYAPSAKRV